MDEPRIIQGGMGVAISDWRLANAVARRGQMGVVSGTGIALILAGRLAQGDPGGHMARALSACPLPGAAERILARYLDADVAGDGRPLRRPPMWSDHPSPELVELTAAAGFCEVWLAREGARGPVGINLLEKIQPPHLATLYGAMLAGVDAVIIGAGIPLQIPGALAALAEHRPARYRLDVAGAGGDDVYEMAFDPEAHWPGIAERVGPLSRPRFLPIVSSVVLAQTLQKRANGPVDGFVVEAPTAGGHNAPPRGAGALDDRGQPVYGPRDEVDLARLRELGVPFWLAGGYGGPGGLGRALAEGAAGIQVGTAFAFCDESGMAPHLRRQVIEAVREGDVAVFTSPVASPTGFPFKVVRLEGTLSDADVYAARSRICDLGYLRTPYKRPDGGLGFRCAAEPVDQYVAKGGAADDAEGRVCLCNALSAAAGFPQIQRGGLPEPPIVTSGDDLPSIARFLRPGREGYAAAEVIDDLLAGATA